MKSLLSGWGGWGQGFRDLPHNQGPRLAEPTPASCAPHTPPSILMAPPDPAYLSKSVPAPGPLLQEAHSELCFSNAVSTHTFSPSSGFWAPYTTT